MTLTSSWLRSLGPAGLGMLLALALLLAGAPGRKADPDLGPGPAAILMMRRLDLAGPGGGRPWRVHVEDLVIQRRRVGVFGIAGNNELVLRGTTVHLDRPGDLRHLLARAGPTLRRSWPGLPVRCEKLTLRVGSQAAPWTLDCAAAEWQPSRRVLLRDVRVVPPDGTGYRLPEARWDLRTGELEESMRARPH